VLYSNLGYAVASDELLTTYYISGIKFGDFPVVDYAATLEVYLHHHHNHKASIFL
jgi:hypothetical protein